MKHIISQRIIFFLLMAMTTFGGMALYLEKFLNLDNHKDQIITELEERLQRKVSYTSGTFTLRYGPSFTFTGITIKNRDNTSEFLHADRLTLRLALLPLLEKKVIIKGLDLDAPRLDITRFRNGTLSIDDLLQEKRDSVNLQISGIKVSKGIIGITDLAASPEGIRMVFSGTELGLTRIVRGKNCGITLTTSVGDGQHNLGAIVVKGRIKLAPATVRLDQSDLDLDVTTRNLDAAPFWAYYSRFVPFKKVLGLVSVESSFKGKITDFTAKGNLRLAGLHFDYQPIFHAVLEPKDLRLGYTLRLKPGTVAVSAVDIVVDGLKIKGGCAITEIGTGDPRITAHAALSAFQLEQFHHYIPYGVIIDETADFIEHKMPSGLYKVSEARLDGKVSQILSMEKAPNYNILYVKGYVEKGVIQWGSGLPLFSDIKGDLELVGKDFNLKHMSGRFGASPFTLDGSIRDFPVVTPTLYPFTMVMTPAPADVAWLFSIRKDSAAGISGKSTLHLSGDGSTKNFALAGSWDLTPAAYNIPGFLAKPSGRTNSTTFKLEFSPELAVLKNTSYSLPPLTANLAGEYRYDNEALSFSIKTGQFLLNDLAPLSPRIAPYQPKGNIQVAISGAKADTDHPVKLSGTVTFGGASLKPGREVKELTDLNGTVTFKDDSLQTSLLSAKLGSTPLHLKGTLRTMAHPVINVDFSAPFVDPADLGMKTTGKEFRPSRVMGSIQYQEDEIHINSFSTQINNSRLDINGSIRDFKHPTINLNVSAPRLESADILPLAQLERVNPDRNAAPPTIKIALKSEAGNFGGVEFERLSSDLLFEDNVLYLQPLQFQALGGSCSGKVRIDSPPGAASRYQISYELRNVSAQGLLTSLGVKQQEVWGSLSAQGELTARGSNRDEIEQSLLGSLKMHIEKGSIRRFNSLAKIFSILNVSQLFKLHLPEMVTGGMPFDDISGTVAIKDGIFTTTDLFVKSKAMNISAVGSMNLPTGTLDLKVGVQPLQAVDKVVNRIPIVGWILTGKDASWITTYFEVKGKMSDAQVSAIPVTSMAKGVFDIFKRVFQLPVKLFTDTGEVILGK